MFHCFTETAEVARAALDLGFYISFSGILTFKNAADLRDVARFVPLDRCLIETDSPYLAPVPYRGKINNPAYVPYVARQLAEVKELDVEAGAQRDEPEFRAPVLARDGMRNNFRYLSLNHCHIRRKVLSMTSIVALALTAMSESR